MKRAWVAAVAAVVFATGCQVGEPRQEFRQPPRTPSDPCASSGDSAGAPMEPPPIEDGPVVSPARPPPPVSGGTLAVLSDGSFVAADPDRDVVWLVGSDRQTIRKVSLAAGDEPGRVVEGPAGHVFVALRGTGEVVELEVANASIVERRAVCGAPRGLAWLSSEATLVVACATGTLNRLTYAQDTAGAWRFVSVERQSPAEDLRDVVSIGGVLYVSTFRTGKLLAVDRSGRATELQLPSLDAGEGVFSDGGMFAPRFARGVAWRMVAGSQGPFMLHQWSSLAPIQATKTACGEGSSTQYDDPLGGALVRNGLTLLENGVPRNDDTIPFSRPGAVDVAAGSGPTWVVATRESLHAGWSDKSNGGIGGVGQPTSVAWFADGVVAFSREPAMLIFWNPLQSGGFTTLNLPAESARSTAHELFHRVTPSGISCASCHPEAGDDGRVWLLPEGSRRTPSLRGGLAGTAPFHWSGDLDGMKSLMDEVMVRRMGGLMQTQERTDALLSWLDAQKPMRAPDGVDLAAATRGRALFESSAVGCASCHSGAQGTNNANADVGTGELFQVPRLTELGTRAPYFHDGRITKLEDRFNQNGGGDLHGRTSQLSAQELADLVTYLKTR